MSSCDCHLLILMAVGNHRRKQSVIVREESRVQNRVLHAPPLYVAMIGMLGYHRGVIRSSSNLIALASTTLAFLRQMCPLRRPAVNSEFSATPTLQEHNYAFLMPPPRVERSSALQRLLVAFAVEGSYRQVRRFLLCHSIVSTISLEAQNFQIFFPTHLDPCLSFSFFLACSSPLANSFISTTWWATFRGATPHPLGPYTLASSSPFPPH